MFKKILVANRGEIALRIFRTCREMKISTVAVYSIIDAQAPFVHAADQAVCLEADNPADSYLNIDKIIRAALSNGADAIHPGYGFLSENSDFAQACLDAGLGFIGPEPKTLASLGDKIEARRIAESANVPIIPGTLEPTEDVQELIQAAEKIGFPVMVKAAAGGGGKGMRRVEQPADLDRALERATSEAQAAFGNGALYLEKCIEAARHVEVQILSDQHQNYIHLLERECSIQRRHQKIIEEAPALRIDKDLRHQLGQAAIAVARKAGYQNAGTVEFLLCPDDSFYFMEVNARLQVEHPVTELICGIDLVEMQIKIAAGQPLALSQDQVAARGHAIECRIYAEDPENNFMPSPGEIVYLRKPGGPGIRFDSGIESGSLVPQHYDPILAKLIAWGDTRDKAVTRMVCALQDTVILGVETTVEFLLSVVESEMFAQGRINTDFIAKNMADWQPSDENKKVAMLAWLMTQLDSRNMSPKSQTRGLKNSYSSSDDPWHRIGHWRMG
jgi:acetyl-CoA carboxylase biotin carboxylase subunit